MSPTRVRHEQENFGDHAHDRPDYLTKKKVAERCSVSSKTVGRWIQAGLPAIQVRPKGRLLIRIKDLADFLNIKRVAQSPSLDSLVEETLRELNN